MDKLRSALARTLGGTGCDDYECSVCNVSVFALIYLHRRVKRQTVRYILSLTFCTLAVNVYQHHLAEKPALHKRISRCGSDVTAADNCTFSYINFCSSQIIIPEAKLRYYYFSETYFYTAHYAPISKSNCPIG